MSYRLNYTDRFKKTLREIDRQDIVRILKKAEWLAQRAEQVRHERVRNPPDDLDKICKYRLGIYRILYCIESCQERHNGL